MSSSGGSRRPRRNPTPEERFKVLKPKLEKKADKEFTNGSFKEYEKIVKYIAEKKGDRLWTEGNDNGNNNNNNNNNRNRR